MGVRRAQKGWKWLQLHQHWSHYQSHRSQITEQVSTNLISVWLFFLHSNSGNSEKLELTITSAKSCKETGQTGSKQWGEKLHWELQRPHSCRRVWATAEGSKAKLFVPPSSSSFVHQVEGKWVGKSHSENSWEIPSLGEKKFHLFFLKRFPCFVSFLYCSFIRKKSRFCSALWLNSPPSDEEGREHRHSIYMPFMLGF